MKDLIKNEELGPQVEVKYCSQCKKRHPITEFYTKGLDAHGNVRHESFCIKSKLKKAEQERKRKKQKEAKLKLIQPRAKNYKVEVSECSFVVICDDPNIKKTALKYDVEDCLRSFVLRAVRDCSED